MLAAISRTALRRAPTTSLSSSYSTTPLSSFQVVTSGLDDPKDIELNQAIKALDKDVDLARHKTANKKTQYHEKGWMKKKVSAKREGLLHSTTHTLTHVSQAPHEQEGQEPRVQQD